MTDRYIVLDVETTGLDPYNNSVIEIGAICFEEREEDQYPVEISRYVGKMSADQYSSIDVEALQVNKRMLYGDVYSSETLAGEVWVGFAEWLARYCTKETIIIGHNVDFDLKFLEAGANRFRIDLKRVLSKKKLDTKQVALFLKDSGVIDPGNFRLITLWNYFFLDDKTKANDENPHDAITDALMTSQIYFHMREIL